MPNLTVDDVIYIHDQIITVSGGLAGVRDPGQLQACLARPNQSAFGEDIFGDLFMKAASLLEAVANTHPFVDGNKRTAMAAAVLYLQIHNIAIDFSNQEYEDFMLEVVEKKLSIASIKSWLMGHADMKT